MRLAKGTRAKVVRPFTSQDRLGDVFEVAECDSESITLSRCYSDSNSYLHEHTYTMPTDEFGVFFEIIGMEEPEKTSDDRVITLSLSEDDPFKFYIFKNIFHKIFENLLISHFQILFLQ